MQSAIVHSNSLNGFDHGSLLVLLKFPETRESLIFTSGDSILHDVPATRCSLVAYPYDPTQDKRDTPDTHDFLRYPGNDSGLHGDKGAFLSRGILNISVLTLTLALLSRVNYLSGLFSTYPYKDTATRRMKAPPSST
jgi:hypothetical protein